MIKHFWDARKVWHHTTGVLPPLGIRSKREFTVNLERPTPASFSFFSNILFKHTEKLLALDWFELWSSEKKACRLTPRSPIHILTYLIVLHLVLWNLRSNDHHLFPIFNILHILGTQIRDNALSNSACQCGQIWQKIPLWHNFNSLGQFLRVYLVFGQNMNLTLAKMLCHGASFHCCRWPHTLK